MILNPANAAFLDTLYDAYLADPNAVAPEWRDYFRSLARGALEIGVRYELSVLSSLDGSFSNQLDSSRPMYQPIAGSPDPSVELTSADFVAEGMRNSILSVIAGYRF